MPMKQPLARRRPRLTVRLVGPIVRRPLILQLNVRQATS
ncbi:MAG: hypothetical protein KatS3mg060_0894 [Dehalococcoidia bacterium]|nr:MAG: hypothetical protein KatS3mg060_0894 [Dehalococcoidia bacterium]